MRESMLGKINKHKFEGRRAKMANRRRELVPLTGWQVNEAWEKYTDH